MKNKKRILAILALIFIGLLLVTFFISAFTAQENPTLFKVLFSCIIIVPLISWIGILLYGRTHNLHTMAEFFPESFDNNVPSFQNPDQTPLTEDEIEAAMIHEKENNE